MEDYRTPGVYVKEISNLPSSVAGVATAIPAFVGFTEKCTEKLKPVKVTSLLDYTSKFGGSCELTIDEEGKLQGHEFVMYDSIRLFYDNGGGTCYVASAGTYKEEETDFENLDSGFYTQNGNLDYLAGIDEITMILFPDAAMLLGSIQLGTLQQAALSHCAELKDRIAILDVPENVDLTDFRTKLGSTGLSYGAAYYPFLKTCYTHTIGFEEMRKIDELKTKLEAAGYNEDEFDKMEEGKKDLKIRTLISKVPEYAEKLAELQAEASLIPPSGAIAGIICAVDENKGVWQAPANVSIASVSDVTVRLSDKEQADYNVDNDYGKSINVIRYFQGKGIIVWGARTLDGNSNEWRYLPVRRLYNYIEESIQKSIQWAVFQPNDANTWMKIQCQIENFLSNLWRDGALAGSTPEQAFYVRVGLNVTMDAKDIQEGRLNVEIGLAAVRPAEFIVLKFSHKVQEA